MAELLLDSLEIKGYRCFEHLTIEKLGRVNLIVGKNNVGKTALLEALEIYFREFSDTDELISRRNEIQQDSTVNLNRLNKGGFDNLLFQKEGAINKSDSYFLIGQKEHLNQFNSELIIQENNFCYDLIKKNVPFEIGATASSIVLLFISSSGLPNKLLTQLWDSIIFTEKESQIVNALNLISPTIERIAFVNYPDNEEKRIAIVKITNYNSPVSLGRLGEGMNRLLGIALALVNCRNGILLIDEIENGFHYSILPDVWKLIFKTAKDLNVQVFATTHSKDCIEAFTQAAVDDEESEGMLIRLVRKEDKIKAFTFDEKELETITNDDIEVR